MTGIIFAAGIGSRLKPFTDSHPKALAPVAGVPLLLRVAQKLCRAGVGRLIVNTHHFPEQIHACIAASDYAQMTDFSDEQPVLLDTGGAMALIARENAAFRELPDDEPVIVHNADIYTDFDITEMVRCHISSGADATILVDPRRESTRHFLFDADRRLRGWENVTKDATRPEGLDKTCLVPSAFGGVHVISAGTIRRISAEQPDVIEPLSITDWYIDNCGSASIVGYTPSAPFRWHDIGTTEKLKAANDALSGLL